MAETKSRYRTKKLEKEAGRVSHELESFGIQDYDGNILNKKIKDKFRERQTGRELEEIVSLMNNGLVFKKFLNIEDFLKKRGVSCEDLLMVYHLSTSFDEVSLFKFLDKNIMSIVDIENYSMFKEVIPRKQFRKLEKKLLGLEKIGTIELSKNALQVSGVTDIIFSKKMLEYYWMIIVALTITGLITFFG